MTKFYHTSKTFGLVLLLMLSVFNSGIAFGETNPTYCTQNYSGEELVRGILLADGIVADQIPELREFSITSFTSDAKIKNTLAEFNNQVIYQIKQSNPDFFNSFKSKIDSHKHAAIRSAIEEGKSVVLKAMAKVNDSSKLTLDEETKALSEEIRSKMGSASSVSEAATIARNYLNNQYNNSALAPCSAIAIETATVAIAVRVAVAIYTEYYFWPEQLASPTANNLIFQESIINTIATKL